MLPIPEKILALLKSRVMVGDRRPTGVLTVQDQPTSGYDPLDPETWTDWITLVGDDPVRTWGNMTETADGRAIIAYIEGDVNGSKELKIAYASSPEAVLTDAEDFATAIATTLKSSLTDAQVSLALVDGKLLLCLTHKDSASGNLVAECWRDTDGNGTGFAKLTDMHSNLDQDNAYNFDYMPEPSMITKMGDGNLVCLLPYYRLVTLWQTTVIIVYSTDGGASWSIGDFVGVARYGGWTASGSAGNSRSLLRMSNSEFAFTMSRGNGIKVMISATSSGIITDDDYTHDYPYYSAFADLDGTWYMICGFSTQVKLYSFAGDTENYNIGDDDANDVTMLDNWTLITFWDRAGYSEYNLHFTATALIAQHSHNDMISAAGVLREYTSVTIPVKIITIDKPKGSAAQATVVIDNKNGMYSPDNSASEWFQKLWLDKQVEITLGYGGEQVSNFLGTIDDIEMEATPPATLTLYNRDFAKRALDQTIQETIGEITTYALTYENTTPEAMFYDLALKAGWAAENIHVEVTGRNIIKYVFGHEKFADAFQKLSELVAWEWICDGEDIYYRPPMDPDPVAVYTFTEGVDIFSLRYKFSGADLYRNVCVWTVDDAEPPNIIKVIQEWSAADYNNVLPLKTMIIDATNMATTLEECQAIANAAVNSITPKPRFVTFVAVGNPYLKNGDCIQVIESTTTISEIYRIVNLRQIMDSSANPVFVTEIECYHYAFAQVPEDVPIEYVEPETPPVIPDDYEEPTFPVYPTGTDVTADIQAQIDAAYARGGGTVFIPEGEYWIDVDTSIILKNNVNLSLADNAILYAIPTATSINAVIMCNNVRNVSIIGGQIVGDKNTHLGSSGEHGMGIWMAGTTDCVIRGTKIFNCWGDGIYLGNGTQGYCNNTLIEDVTIANCRRNGIGVISNKNLTVRNVTISYIDGDDPTYNSLPQCGIDIEPNVNTDWLYKLVFENVVTNYCQGFGILCTLWWYSGFTNTVDVDFIGCADTGSLRNADYETGEDPYIEAYTPSANCSITIS